MSPGASDDNAIRLPLPFSAGFVLLTLALVMRVAATPPGLGKVAALFPPWWTPEETLAAASMVAPVVRFGSAPFVVVVSPAGGDLAVRLRGAGAWLVVDAAMAGGCLEGRVADAR